MKKVPHSPAKSAFALAMAFFLLLGLTGCENQNDSSLETYHNKDYGFSLSIDKELMEYIMVQSEAVESAQKTILDFYYYEEGTRPSSAGIESSYITWGVFFSVYIVPMGTVPQDIRVRLMGSNDLYSFYFGILNTPFDDTAVRERFEYYEDKINEIPSSFSADFPSRTLDKPQVRVYNIN